MADVKALQQERISIYHDVFDNKIPKRVPVNLSFALEVVAQYGKLNLVDPVSKVFPQAHLTVALTYLGWIPFFTLITSYLIVYN